MQCGEGGVCPEARCSSREWAQVCSAVVELHKHTMRKGTQADRGAGHRHAVHERVVNTQYGGHGCIVQQQRVVSMGCMAWGGGYSLPWCTAESWSVRLLRAWKLDTTELEH